LIAFIFKTAGDRSFLSNFDPPLRTPTALEDDVMFEVFINIIAPMRYLLICERQNRISIGKLFRKTTQWDVEKTSKNIFEHFITHKRHSIAYIFKTAGDRWFLSNSNPTLRTPTALKKDLLIDVLFNITAPIRCLLIRERGNEMDKRK